MATPKLVSISKIKESLLKPALTSHYVVDVQAPQNGFLGERLSDYNSSTKREDRLTLACVEASLPGSSLATIDIDNDYHGVSEKHAYRRIYDDRIDFTFYVDGNEYWVIRFFESWISYIVNEQQTGFDDPNYTYRVYYPTNYYANMLSITKFERDYDLSSVRKRGTGSTLTYTFIKAFPISIQSMPVSYEQANLLKCTVSFSYSRYRVNKGVTQSVVNTQPTNQNANQAPLEYYGPAFNSDEEANRQAAILRGEDV